MLPRHGWKDNYVDIISSYTEIITIMCFGTLEAANCVSQTHIIVIFSTELLIMFTKLELRVLTLVSRHTERADISFDTKEPLSRQYTQICSAET